MLTGGCCQIVLKNAKHLREALISEVDIAWMHLVQNELIAVVAILS